MLSIAQKKGIDISAVDLLAVDLADKSSGTPLINEQSGSPGQYHVAPSASLHEGAEQFYFMHRKMETSKFRYSSGMKRYGPHKKAWRKFLM